MSTYSGTTRWWENYLPRYLMPSIAGMAIVNLLCSYGDSGLKSILSLPASGTPVDTASLTLLFLYGNLFCYIASYPVLVFHATRVMDFSDGKWRAHPLVDGYLVTIALIACVFLLQRGIPAVEETEKKGSGQDQTNGPEKPLDEDEEEKEEVTTTRSRTNLWRQEFMDTYRHLREHGNSAFIFLLEIALAALAYCVITKPGQSAAHQLAAIGWLFAIWAIPSALVHLHGQLLERRFSRYDQKLESATTP